MRRRDFITLLGGATAANPLTARAQGPAPMRRVGVLMMYPENDPEGRLRAAAFQEGLEKLGWMVGRNLAIDYRWGAGDVEWARTVTAELLTLAPDVIVANTTTAARAAQLASRTVPIVFIGPSDPVALGLVASLSRPGGNMTGFTNMGPTVGPKWLDLLKKMAPRVTRVAVLFNPNNPGNVSLARSVASVAKTLAAEVVEAPIREVAEIEAAITRLGREPGGGLIIPPDPVTAAHRKLIIELAERNRLPAIYALRVFIVEGGLMSYGVNIPDLFRQAAAYVHRILRGEKPADLAVQMPTTFELIINLKTARALGLTVPATLRVAADEVIE
jgi:putative ABC transport system substrate-binding protein